MNQLLNNIQAALAALRMSKPNPALWSGPAATAFMHRIDLLEIELTAICTLLGGSSLGGGTPIGLTPVVPLTQMIAQLGLHL
jgi:hypothetical protein